MEEKKSELVQLIETSSLEEQTAVMLREKFLPFYNQATEWKEKALALVVTDINQTDEMKQAREARLLLKDIRVDADKLRKELKEDSLRYGKAVQGIYNFIENLITPIEEHLLKQEKFVEIEEIRIKRELCDKRITELKPYEEFVPLGIDFGNMIEEDYQKFLNGVKLQLKDKIEQEKKEEQEKTELEQRKKKHIDREFKVRDYGRFFDWDSSHEETSDEDFEQLVQKAEKAKRSHLEQEEKQQKENELLRKEKEEKEAEEKAKRETREKRNGELRPYVIFIRDYNRMLELPEEEYKKEFEEMKKGAEDHWEHERKQKIKKAQEEQAREESLRKEKEKADRLAKELADKTAKEDRETAERLAKEEEELSKGDTAKMADVIVALNTLKTKYEFKSKKFQKKYKDVGTLIDKIIEHIHK